VQWLSSKLGLAVAIALSTVVTACASEKPEAGSRSTTASTVPALRTVPTASTTTATVATSIPPSPTTTLAQQRAPQCRSSQLALSEAHGGTGLGHSAVIILLRNSSTTTCTLVGYPGVAGLDSAGQQVAQATRMPNGYMGGLAPENRTPPVVTLAAGQTASAQVEGTDNPQGSQTTCPRLSGLLATGPNTYLSVRLPYAPGDCSGLEVHPVVTGNTGNQQD
jgi:hypothetical protein